MPTYQYACTDCGHQLEAVQSFSDPSLTDCPVCQGRLRKVFGSVGVVFKGSGFYRTDSRSGSSSTAPASAGSDKPATKTDTPKTDSKPTATPATSSSSSAASSSSSSSSSKSSSNSAA